MTKYSKILKKHALACMLASAFISNAVAETSTAANEIQSEKESFVAVHTNNVVNIDGKACVLTPMD